MGKRTESFTPQPEHIVQSATAETLQLCWDELTATDNENPDRIKVWRETADRYPEVICGRIMNLGARITHGIQVSKLISEQKREFFTVPWESVEDPFAKNILTAVYASRVATSSLADILMQKIEMDNELDKGSEKPINELSAQDLVKAVISGKSNII